MSNALLLVPDFLLIALGCAICRLTPLNRPVWDAVERLVYYLLFPVLLFNSIVESSLEVMQAVNLAAAGLGTLACGIVLALSLRYWPGIDERAHASGAQVVFRFNSFILLALAERLGGTQGLTWAALIIALTVPLNNFAAVWPLARQGGRNVGSELLRNPIIIGTVAGIVANLAGLKFPEAVSTTLQRIGLAALPLGLMAVGAGLRLGGLKSAPGLAAMLLALRHAALPLIAIGLAFALGLSPEQRLIVVLYASVPTASSAYVLAARMGGDGSFVAGIVSLSTLLGVFSIALWLAVVAWLGA